MPNPYRDLPAVHEVLALLGAQGEFAVAFVRDELKRFRDRLKLGESLGSEAGAAAVASRVAIRLEEARQPLLRPVINATGILLHTNLGRAPLAEAAASAAYQAGRGYLNLELDLATGQRSSRQDVLRELLSRLLGCESATAVNNNAAATVLALRALAAGREVIVSRGELVEIGGSFRIPEIMAVSGAILKEVGSTNITRIGDYEAALTERSAVLLRVHASNYKIVGHTQAPALEELVALAHRKNLLVIDDVGSGALLEFGAWGLRDEPQPKASLATGADLVLFSGDKLLGGPQAGILAGKADLIRRLEKDPLMRAFRLDKMTLAALEATLRLHAEEATRLETIPLLRMVNRPLAELQARAERLGLALGQIEGVSAQPHAATAFVGGGALPSQGLPSVAVAAVHVEVGPNEWSRRLRVGRPSVVARVEADQVWFDVRTIFPEQEEALVAAVRQAVKPTA